MKRFSTSAATDNVDTLNEKIKLIEQHIQNVEGPYGPDNYDKKQVQDWIGQLRVAVKPGADLKGAQAHINVLMKSMQLNLPSDRKPPVQKPVNKLAENIRRGSTAAREAVQSFIRSDRSNTSTPASSRPGSVNLSASNSPQVSRANAEPKPFKVQEEQLNSIMQAENEISQRLGDLKKEKKIDIEISQDIERNIQGVYQFEVAARAGKPLAGKPLTPELTDQVMKTLDQIKSVLKLVEKGEAIVPKSQQPNADVASKESSEAKDAAVEKAGGSKTWVSARAPNSEGRPSSEMTSNSVQLKTERDARLSTGAEEVKLSTDTESRLKDIMDDIFDSDEEKGQDLSPRGNEPVNTAKASETTPPASPPQRKLNIVDPKKLDELKAAYAEEQKSQAPASPQGKEPVKASEPVSPPRSPTTGRIKLVGLKQQYQKNAAEKGQQPQPSASANSSPLIQRLRSDSVNNSEKTAALTNASQTEQKSFKK